MNEIEWIVELVDFPDYFISNYGRIFSEYKKEKRIELKPFYDKDGYLLIGIYKEGKKYTKKIHRLVCETFLERVEGKNQVDHINRIKTDNKLENLRWCNRRENNINKGMNINNTSGVKGVSFNKRDNRWIGSIYIEKYKDKHKTFKTKEEAITWRLEMEKKYYN